jgi:hypothetical protein
MKAIAEASITEAMIHLPVELRSITLAMYKIMERKS